MPLLTNSTAIAIAAPAGPPATPPAATPIAALVVCLTTFEILLIRFCNASSPYLVPTDESRLSTIVLTLDFAKEKIAAPVIPFAVSFRAFFSFVLAGSSLCLEVVWSNTCLDVVSCSKPLTFMSTLNSSIGIS